MSEYIMNPSSKMQFVLSWITTDKDRLCVGYSASQYGGSVEQLRDRVLPNRSERPWVTLNWGWTFSSRVTNTGATWETLTVTWQKTMLETSQFKDTLREHRFEAPWTSTLGIFIHERNIPRIKTVEACFTPAPSYNGPWLYQQRKSHFRARTSASLTQKFDLSISNRFEHSVRQVPLSHRHPLYTLHLVRHLLLATLSSDIWKLRLIILRCKNNVFRELGCLTLLPKSQRF